MPKKTFFTTPQKTYILCITKKIDKKEIQKTPVFTYLVSEIGESRDVYRFNIEQDDLNEAVTLYSFFKANKTDFENIIHSDKRCKIIQAKEILNAKKWVIENWWTKEDSIFLGLSDEEKIIKIKEYPSLTFINSHKGNIPVYSASKFPENVDYGYVQDNLPDVKYFENCLTWNIDGSVGRVHYRQGRFSLSEKVIPLILNDEYKNKLDIEFLKYTIENEFAKYSFGFDNKAGKGKIQEIEIEIPILNNGNYDIELQKEIAKKHKFIDKTKKDLKIQMDNLLNTQIVI